MREIKFRAWDGKQMVTPAYDQSQRGRLTETPQYERLIRPGYATTADVPNLTLIQYTGLKDKNGKEIYEGDIVKSQVIYDEIDSASDYHDANLEVRWSMPEMGWRVGYLPLTWSGFQSLEVIGNIMENPELLADKNREA